jgi:hypothetical protein
VAVYPSSPSGLIQLLALASVVAFGGFWSSETGASPSHLEEGLNGRVVDQDGRGLAAASVQLLVSGRVLRSTPTQRDGSFYLAFDGSVLDAWSEGLLSIRVERMGFATVERMLEPSQSEVEIVLQPAPIPLAGFHVEGERPSCDADDAEGLGRRLWEAARNRHPGGLDTLGVATYTMAQVDTLQNGMDWTEGGESDGLAEVGQRGSAPILRLGWDRRIRRAGYAFPVRRTDRSGSFASWSYAPLESDLAPHFGTDLFGEQHYFRVTSEDSEGWWVRFCARDTDHPHLEGRLRIGSDELIHAVEWSFRTEEPDEKAGGRVVFPPTGARGGPPPLLPLESESWRTQRESRTIRRAQWFEEWILAPGDSVPFLPRRSAEARDPRN